MRTFASSVSAMMHITFGVKTATAAACLALALPAAAQAASWTTINQVGDATQYACKTGQSNNATVNMYGVDTTADTGFGIVATLNGKTIDNAFTTSGGGTSPVVSVKVRNAKGATVMSTIETTGGDILSVSEINLMALPNC